MKMLSLELLTNQLEEMKQFYVDRLRFRLKSQSQDSFTIDVGYTALTFRRDLSGDEPCYHFAMNIPAQQWMDAKAWLLQKGCSLLSTPTVKEANIWSHEQDVVFFGAMQAYAIYFYDPAGNLVEFIARKRESKKSDGPFQADSVLNVSEIGLILDQDLPEVMKVLSERFGTTPNTGDGQGFQIMGDDQGMFILIDISRGAYPTGKKLRVHPLQVSIVSGHEDELQLDPYPYSIRSVK